MENIGGGGGLAEFSFHSEPQTSNLCVCHTSEKSAHNSFICHTSKFIGLKTLCLPHIRKKVGEGGKLLTRNPKKDFYPERPQEAEEPVPFPTRESVLSERSESKDLSSPATKHVYPERRALSASPDSSGPSGAAHSASRMVLRDEGLLLHPRRIPILRSIATILDSALRGKDLSPHPMKDTSQKTKEEDAPTGFRPGREHLGALQNQKKMRASRGNTNRRRGCTRERPPMPPLHASPNWRGWLLYLPWSSWQT
jgi:hypothetical protein